MPTVTYNVLNESFVNQEQVYNVLYRDIPKAWNIPIFTEYPSETEKVSYGLYISDVHISERNTYQLAVQFCGAIYLAIDEIQIAYISYQDDPYGTAVSNIIANLVTAVKDDGSQLFDGYFERLYSQDEAFGPTQAERKSWTFRLTRMEFNT